MSSPSSTTSDRIDVLLVDEHPAIREALATRLDEAMGLGVAGACGSTREAMDLLEERAPDVMVLDISLSDSYGLDLVQQVRDLHPGVEIVVFAMYEEEVYAERAIRKGARSYLMKTAPTNQVLEAIRSADAGEVYLSPQMSAAIVQQLTQDGNAELGFPIDQLTDRELAVFQMLGRGYSVSDITDRLAIHRKTVETHRRRAKEKLGLESINELIEHAVTWIHSQSGAETYPQEA